jgi:hypothetical protein
LNDGGNPKFSTSQRAPDYGAASIAIGGKHVFASSWLSWELSAARSRELAAAGNPGATFKTVPGSAADNLTSCVNTPGPDFHLPQWDPSCFGAPTYDPTQYYLNEYDGTQGITSQVNLQGAFSMAKNYHVGSHYSTFEFGLKARNAHKGQDAYSPVYDEPGANCFDARGTRCPNARWPAT